MFSDTFEVRNPFNDEIVAKVKNFKEEELDFLVKKMTGFKSKMSPLERGQILKNLIEKLGKEKERLALLITQETGLALKDTEYEIGRVMNCARFSAIYAEKIENDLTSEYLLEGKNEPELQVITEPLDLVLGITPFNHPMNQVAHKLFPAIIAGSPIIIKPSEKTPLGAKKLVELLKECGLEEEMVEVVTHENPEWITTQLLNNFEFDLISFTGGVEVGKRIRTIMDKGPNSLKKYVPELGGCSSLIVCEDADLEIASDIIIKGVFKNSGQRCTCIRRVVAESPIKSELISILKRKIEDISSGNPFESKTDIGTVISADAAEMISSRINGAIEKGASLLVGGNVDGALVKPTLLDNVTLEMELVSKETFGPVCPVIEAKDFQEALEIAKNTPFALAGGIVTKDKAKALMAQDQLKVGQFNFNGPPSYRTECAPFGGFKDSGNGEKEGIIMSAKAMRRIRTFYRHIL